MAWWIWLSLGLALLVSELLTPGGLVLLFFGCAALVTGILAGTGVVEAVWAQWLLFSWLSVIAVAVLRRPLKERIYGARAAQEVDSLVGQAAVVIEEIAAGGVGKVELRGTAWNARSAGGTPLAVRQRCRVERVEGLTLWVRAE